MTRASARVLVVDDDVDSTNWLEVFLTDRHYQVRTAPDGRTAQLMAHAWPPSVVLLDLGLPDMDGLTVMRRLREVLPQTPIIIVSGRATVPRTVEAMHGGAFSLLEKPVEPEELAMLVQRAAGCHTSAVHQARPDVDRVEEYGRLRSCAPAMHRSFSMARAVAATDANVLLLGENGTGKELLAHAVHDSSPRRDQAFVPINCAAISAELLESELFGYRRGAFTGAQSDRKGLLEAGHRGSVFLDEIADMPMALQPKLLRVLQDRRVRPVGATALVEADFRLICATNVDALGAVHKGRLREDLYFRLNTVTITLPPLRERPEDIPLLAHDFLATYSSRYGRRLDGFDARALSLLLSYRWPGNVRELQHVVERAVILSERPQVVEEDLPDEVRAPTAPANVVPFPTGCTLEQIERLALVQTLEQTRWNKRATAHILGIHRPTLYSKLRKYGLWKGQQTPH